MAQSIHTARVSKRQRWIKQLTLWVGLLCLTAHAASVAHILLVEHVHCAEHGEWVHAEEGHAHDHVASLEVTSSSKSYGPAIEPSPDEAQHGHDHEDCHACSERREISGVKLATSHLSLGQHDIKLRIVGLNTPKAARAIHLSAPKASPPALA